MRIVKGIAIAGLAALALSACGEPAQQGDTVNEKVLVYRGHPIHCIVDNEGYNSETMSCDWETYHKENG